MQMDSKGAQFQKQLSRIEELINALNAAPESPICRQARELVQTLLEFHGAGFEQALELIHDSPSGGQALIDRLAEDPLISNLLVLHNLHPLDLEARVRNALEKVKPRLGLHGGDVDLVEVLPDGIVRLRLEGNCHGCPSSRVTLKSSIEEALYAAAPDITALEVDGAVDRAAIPPSFVPKYTDCPDPMNSGQKIGATV
jgi:Fe-S cluster biogenesis protein NfuA